MNYELAKELKDAGFPQGVLTDRDLMLSATDNHDIADEDNEPVHYPTLEELIEACGSGFQSLSRKDGHGWVAYGTKDVWGNTPIEAVARLWLALNKNKNQ